MCRRKRTVHRLRGGAILADEALARTSSSRDPEFEVRCLSMRPDFFQARDCCSLTLARLVIPALLRLLVAGSARPRSPTLNLTHRSAMLWKLSKLVSDAIMTYPSWPLLVPGLSFAPHFPSSRRLSPPRPANAEQTTLLDFSLDVHPLYTSPTLAATPWRPKRGAPKRVVPNAKFLNKLCPSSDEVLIARLRGLGYTLGLPSIDVNNETVGAAGKDDEEAAEAARFARYRENAPTLLDRLLAAREAEVSRLGLLLSTELT